MNMAFKLLGRKSLLKVNESAKLNTTWFVISALSCLLAMLTSLLVLLQVQQERKSGMHERLKLANVPWWQLMLAKQLIGLLWLTAGFAPLLAALNRLYAGLNPWPVVLAIVLLYWISSSLCLILGYLGRPGETMLLAAWLGMLGILLLGGCIYPWQLLPGWLQQAALISPARWGFTLIYDSLAGKAMPVTALAVLAAMIAASAAGSWLSWRQARPGN
jgi:ABC-type multidrug transport system permease subunit